MLSRASTGLDGAGAGGAGAVFCTVDGSSDARQDSALEESMMMMKLQQQPPLPNPLACHPPGMPFAERPRPRGRKTMGVSFRTAHESIVEEEFE